MEIENIKNSLLELVDTAGESGLSEGQAMKEIAKMYQMGAQETFYALREIYRKSKEEIALDYKRGVFFYHRIKKREPAKSKVAILLAKEAASRMKNESEMQRILDYYRR